MTRTLGITHTPMRVPLPAGLRSAAVLTDGTRSGLYPAAALASVLASNGVALEQRYRSAFRHRAEILKRRRYQPQNDTVKLKDGRCVVQSVPASCARRKGPAPAGQRRHVAKRGPDHRAPWFQRPRGTLEWGTARGSRPAVQRKPQGRENRSGVYKIARGARAFGRSAPLELQLERSVRKS